MDNHHVAEDLFTPEFKRLKARKPPPNLEDVIDLDELFSDETSRDVDVDKCKASPVRRHTIKDTGLHPIVGLKPCQEWNVVELCSVPGLLIIQNPFLGDWQEYWVHRCLRDFPSDVNNVTNLSGVAGFSFLQTWEEFLKRQTLEKSDLLRKLRWTTLGYHHDWDSKVYSESHKAEFPTDVYFLSAYIAAALGFPDFRAQAAIVNYYHLDSTLAGHVDHSEIDYSAPLLSISFGQTAIFMIGGETKSQKPVAIYLHSGDVCVMSGPSRLAYHAVPKIIPSCSENALQSKSVSSVSCCSSKAMSSSSEKDKLPSQGQLPDVVSSSSCASEKQEKTEAVLHSSAKKLCRDEVSGSGVKCESVSKCSSPHPLNLQQDTSEHRSATNLMDLFNSQIPRVNSFMEEKFSTQDQSPVKKYLASSRINLNIRQVLPPGATRLAT